MTCRSISGSMLILMIFVLTMLVPSKMLAQNIQGVAPVATPLGGFAVDGNAYVKLLSDTEPGGDLFFERMTTDNSANPGGLFRADFFETPPMPSLGNGIFTDITNPELFLYPNTFLFRDDITNNDPTIFTSSNKINDNPTTYTWGSGSSPNKNEIQSAFAHFTHGDGVGSDADDLWMIFAADRQVTNGSSYIDFEILQNSLTLTGTTSGAFASSGPDGGRTLGDLLLTIQFTQGGGEATAVIRRWETNGNGGFIYNIITEGVDYPAGTIFITNNTTETIVPYSIYNQDPLASGEFEGYYQYVLNQWAEGAINISDLFTLDPCFTISTLFVRTRTSGNSQQSELKDFPIRPIQLEVSTPPVDVDGPDDVSAVACFYADDAALQLAYTNWLAEFTTVEPGIGEDGDFTTTPPLANTLSICTGDSIELTYSADDGCTDDSVTATFSWIAGAQVDVDGPADNETIACYYADDAALQLAYTNWLAEFVTLENGCGEDGDFTTTPPLANTISICTGDSIELTYSADDGCTDDSATATFSWIAGAQVDVDGPADNETIACYYADDAALQLAYTNWLAEFVTLENGCGDDGDFTTTPPLANTLSICTGDSIELTYSADDGCTDDSVTATFSWIAGAQVDVDGPADNDTIACYYADDAALQLAYTNWLAEFVTLENGCGDDGDFTSTPPAADMSICTGGSIELTYSADDGCTDDSVTATFSWIAGDAVDVDGPADNETMACNYADDAALQLAYTNWLAEFTTLENGCGDDGDFTTTPPLANTLSICTGDSIELTYSADDGCTDDSVTATFSWEAGAQVDVDGPDNVSTGECFYANNAALQLAYSNWLAEFTTLENGCGDDGDFTSTPPDAATLSIVTLVNITLTYSADDGCTNDSVTASFVAEPCLANEGCTLGYWKNHTDRWDCYETCTPYISIFTASTFDPSLTLLEALNLEGNTDAENLARQSVAALLNICSGEVSYPEFGTIQSLVDYVNAAFVSGDVNLAASHLDFLNNSDCPLSGSNATTAPSDGCPAPTFSSSSTAIVTSDANLISASPVPFKDALNIKYDFDYSSSASIQIFDLQGRLLKTFNEANATKGNVSQLSIDFRVQPNQVYILKVTTDRDVFTKKIISDK